MVANEVKELAKENARADSATGSASINDHIADIVSRAQGTKRSVEQVGHSAQSLHEIASRVKSLVEVYRSDKG